MAVEKPVPSVRTREELHRLVDALPDEELYAAVRYLDYLRRTSLAYLREVLDKAPIDDEPLTEEDLKAIEEAEAEIARGEVLSWEEVRREFQGKG